MSEPIFILKGNIVYSRNEKELAIYEHGYLVCRNGKVDGIYQTLPFRLGGNPIRDYGDCLIIPGLVDLHIHAPQYSYRGLGMDMELLEWLEVNTFPEEAKFESVDYAKKAYGIFVENLRRSATTRACIFGTVHRPATLLLMDMLEKTGLDTYVGKVNMDRNCPEYICVISNSPPFGKGGLIIHDYRLYCRNLFDSFLFPLAFLGAFAACAVFYVCSLIRLVRLSHSAVKVVKLFLEDSCLLS